MSMFSLNVGVSAMQAYQQALQTVSNNIANASTPGYHRQQVRFVDRNPITVGRLQIGTGVDVSALVRVRSAVIEQSLTTNIWTQADVNAQLETLQQLETLLTPGEGTLPSRLQTVFDRMFQLSSRPDDGTLRRQAVNSVQDLAQEINSLSASMDRLQQMLDAEIGAAVETVNQLTAQIAALNRQIGISENGGSGVANDLRDQRDQLMGELAQYVDVRTWGWAGQQDVAAFGSGGVPLSTQPVTISVVGGGAELQIQSDQSGQVLNFAGGRIAGLLAARNELIPEAQQRLATFTAAFVRGMDQLQATGLGLDGPFGWLESTRAVSDVAAPLSTAGTAFAVNDGELAITITDLSTGERRLVSVPINPAADSLTDVAAAIDALDHLQATVDAQTGKIAIFSDDGYAFDFAGRLETAPDLSGVTGTSSVQFSGEYGGTENGGLEFTVIGGGEVGVTAGLQVEVRNQNGALLTTLDIGTDYEPGSALDVGNGVSVQFGPGTLNAADTFETLLIADPDTSGILSALGIRSFFSGSTPGTLSVSRDLQNDPSRLAAGRSGLPGDAENVARFTALREELLMEGGTLTLEEFLAESSALAGSRVQQFDATLSHLDALGTQLQTDRESVSGVDPNEEMVKLLQYQRGFQSAAKLISVVNETLDELFAMVP
jgi:flagellar hook-associated protein FlgK